MSRVEFTRQQVIQNYSNALEKNAFPFGVIGIFTFILFIVIYLVI